VTGDAGRGGPHFLVVGSARSGTTLVQRLACELPGVGMPPETHFFDLFVPDLLRRGAPPFDGRRLAEEIDAWRRMEQVRGMDVDAAAVVAELGGRCDSLVQLFDVLVRSLVPAAERYGEKTPKHLLWWRPLSGARPAMKVVAVVRDPRSVVASNLSAPWATGISDWDWGDDLHVAMAERWRVEQEQVLLMARVLGPRCAVLRYEDVVADPERARGVIARLIGADDRVPVADRSGAADIVLPWETWKAEALADVHARRVDAWRTELGERRGRVVAGVCAGTMTRFGYRRGARDRVGDAAAAMALRPRTQRRRLAYRRKLLAEIEWINGVTV
jgi:hypothetical protein